MLRLTSVIGHWDDPTLQPTLHRLVHDEAVEYLWVAARDAARQRLRLTGDRGSDCAIILPREQSLAEGAVLWLDEGYAIVVRLGEQHWLRLSPTSAAVALRLGYHAGNFHWRVRFEGDTLAVALDGAASEYLQRLAPHFATDEVHHVVD